MANSLPSLILTGASGIVGRGFLAAARDRFHIYAIARRPQQGSGVPYHPNIEWIQVDISNARALRRVTSQIQSQGGADYLLHLAAYYDFVNQERPEFQTSNIDGTRNVLDQAAALAVERFIFTSSVAACRFPAPGEAIDEETAPDADFPYARSKRVGEAMVRQASADFPCSVVRLAAVVSDWCEYAPLYMFLETWLSGGWDSRILGGRGTSAVPYIHTRDVNRLFLTILGRSEALPPYAVYQASPDGATSQVELFELATRFHFGESASPVYMPRALAAPGILARDLLGRLLGNRPFLRPWMLKYLDRALTIDSSRTRRELGWAPTPRLHILRRLPFMIAKMKSEPQEWRLHNERAMRKLPIPPSLVIHDAMVEAREAIVDGITAYLQSPVRHDRFPSYAMLPPGDLRWYVKFVYELLTAAVRTGDRSLLLGYMRDLARRRFEEGFPPAEVCDALLSINEVTVDELLHKPEVTGMAQQLRDTVTLSIALAIDGIQDAYEEFSDEAPETNGELSPAASQRELEEIVERLNAFYRPLHGNGRRSVNRVGAGVG